MWKISICFCLFIIGFGMTRNSWEQPGCSRIGYTKNISIPGCVEFQVTTNACRGYCTSYSIPSPESTVKRTPNQMITSVGSCCNIMESEDVNIKLLCLEGFRDIVFKSAKTCSCFQCKKD